MLLSPHHFQHWDQYYEELLNFRVKTLCPFDWGITGLQIDQEGLANGHFTLLRCGGTLPDGLPVGIPETDAAPDSRPIEEHFTPQAEVLDVYLAVPVKRPDAANCTLQGDGARVARYAGETIHVIDDNTNENERVIDVAKKNFRVLFGDESLDGYTYLKIAELKRSAEGLIVLNSAYIPPCLTIAASDPLMGMVRRLLEILMTKSSELSGQRGQRVRDVIEFTPAEVADFWLLHTVNSFIPVLAHFYHVRRGHPEQLFLGLSQLAGQLMTFVANRHPKDLPKYVHTNLALPFRDLDETIQELLNVVHRKNYVRIPLEKVRESLYAGRITDDSLLDSAQFYLAAASDAEENVLIECIPRDARVASRDSIEMLIERALRGVRLHHAAIPPRPLPVRMGYHYFRLENRGDYWSTVTGSRTVAIYIPGLSGLKLDLYAIWE